MVDGNAKNSVRSRIDALVGAQEARDGVRRVNNVSHDGKADIATPAKVTQLKVAEKVEKNETHSKRRLPVILASVFGAIALGLVVAIVILKPWESNGNNNDISEDSADLVTIIDLIEPAAEASQEIIINADNDPNYSSDDAVRDFESLMERSSGAGKVYVAFYYSNFIFTNYDDSARAIAILERVENLVDEDNKIAYEFFLDTYNNGEDRK